MSKKLKVQFTEQELNIIKEMISYNLEIIGQDIANSGYKHPGDIQAWGQDITTYGMILEKISKLKEGK
jgi:hypothetical protein